jgi:hypothetical protein
VRLARAMPVLPTPEITDPSSPLPWGRRSTDGARPADEELGCRIIDLPRIADPRGNLTFVEGSSHIPFDIQRVFYLYDVPGGEARGGHAHRELQQLIIATAGSFDVVVDNGARTARYLLNRSYYGLYVPAMHWTHLENFSSGSVSLVLASLPYEEADYYRDYDGYLSARRLTTA